MQGVVRTGVLVFTLFLVASATGCSSSSEPGSGSATLCKTNLDCSSLGSSATCESGTCQVPSVLGAGGGGNAGPPARGAIVESIQPAPGSTSGCQAASAPFVAPPNVDPVNGTAQTLMCDVSVPGCNPNANVVINGANASVGCSVTNGPDSFAVNATLSQGDVGFTIQGTLMPVGGKAFVSSRHAQYNLQDPNCDVTIEPNKGEIKPGAIWATFNCTSFGDPSSAAGPGCVASGKFIFENCDK